MGEEVKKPAGEVRLSKEVIAQYAGAEAAACFGVVGLGAYSVKDGIVKVLKREKQTHGISVENKTGKISLELHIVVAYGVSIQAVADSLISNVSYQVESFTGMEVEKISIFVEGVRVVD